MECTLPTCSRKSDPSLTAEVVVSSLRMVVPSLSPPNSHPTRRRHEWRNRRAERCNNTSTHGVMKLRCSSITLFRNSTFHQRQRTGRPEELSSWDGPLGLPMPLRQSSAPTHFRLKSVRVLPHIFDRILARTNRSGTPDPQAEVGPTD